MFKMMTGPRMNLVSQGAGYGASATGPACSASMDSSFPLANAYNGRPASPAKLAAISTGFYVSFPNNLVPNGDFEQGTTGWTTAISATPTSETGAGNYHKGAKSLKIVSSAPGGMVYRDIVVQAGTYLQVWAAAKSDGTNATSMVLRCLETNLDLKSDGTWAAGQNVFSKSNNTMAAFSPVAFRVPTFQETGKGTVTLRIHLVLAATSQTVYWDEVLLVPGVNFAGVFGHNLDAVTGLALSTSGASYWHSPSFSISFGAAANSAFVRQAASVSTASLVYDPFPAVYFYPGGAYGSIYTTNIPAVGEIVVGQTFDLGRNPNYPVAVEYREPNIRFGSSGGTNWVLPRGSRPLRRVTMSFDYFNDTDYQEARDAVYGMSRGGAYPIVLVPTETDAGEAIFGRLEDSTTFRRDNYVQRTAEFVVQEEAFPWL